MRKNLKHKATELLDGKWHDRGKQVRHIWEEFYEDGGFMEAAALSFTTVLALVPVTAISLAILATFSGSEDAAGIGDTIRKFLSAHLVPDSREMVIDRITNFAEKARTISFVGWVILILISLFVFNAIESSFNQIWKVKNRRPLVARFISFWSLITLGPILLGISIYLSTNLKDMPIISGLMNISVVSEIIFYLLPFLFTWTALILGYILLPNTHVKMKTALVGGIVAGTMWELGKLGFDWYASTMVETHKVYGSLSIMPAFLAWIYFTWVVILWGVQTCYVIQNPDPLEAIRSRRDESFSDEVCLAVRLVMAIGESFLDGKGTLSVGELSEKIGEDKDRVGKVLSKLEQNDILYRADGTDGSVDYLPQRWVERTTVREIIKMISKIESGT